VWYPLARGGHLFSTRSIFRRSATFRRTSFQMVDGDAFHLGAGVSAAVDQLQERADLVQREAELVLGVAGMT